MNDDGWQAAEGGGASLACQCAPIEPNLTEPIEEHQRNLTRVRAEGLDP
jgi:hypothetical protein